MIHIVSKSSKKVQICLEQFDCLKRCKIYSELVRKYCQAQIQFASSPRWSPVTHHLFFSHHSQDGNPATPVWSSTIPMMAIHHSKDGHPLSLDAFPQISGCTWSPTIPRMITYYPHDGQPPSSKPPLTISHIQEADSQRNIVNTTDFLK